MAAHPHEIHEKSEHAHKNGHKGIGLTIAIVAALSAFVTLLISHTSTDKVILETRIADWWAYTHTNDSNSRLYAINARIAELSMSGSVAQEFRNESARQRKESDDARVTAQKLEQEAATLTRKGNYYSGSELFLQFSVVLCSVALLTEGRMFWKASWLTTFLGMASAVVGLAAR